MKIEAGNVGQFSWVKMTHLEGIGLKTTESDPFRQGIPQVSASSGRIGKKTHVRLRATNLGDDKLCGASTASASMLVHHL